MQPNTAAHAHAQSTSKQQAAVREVCAAGKGVASTLRQRHTNSAHRQSARSTSCCCTRKRQYGAWICTNSNPQAALKNHTKNGHVRAFAAS